MGQVRVKVRFKVNRDLNLDPEFNLKLDPNPNFDLIIKILPTWPPLPLQLAGVEGVAKIIGKGG